MCAKQRRLPTCVPQQRPPIDMSLGACVEFLAQDEILEVTPSIFRMAKDPEKSKWQEIESIADDIDIYFRIIFLNNQWSKEGSTIIQFIFYCPSFPCSQLIGATRDENTNLRKTLRTFCIFSGFCTDGWICSLYI